MTFKLDEWNVIRMSVQDELNNVQKQIDARNVLAVGTADLINLKRTLQGILEKFDKKTI